MGTLNCTALSLATLNCTALSLATLNCTALSLATLNCTALSLATLNCTAFDVSMDSSSGLLSLKWNNHTSTFTGVLSHLRDNNLYADAALACEGKVFSVHKLVLSTCSEYFQKIFEETDCRRPVIVLKDIKCSELDALLSYMYLGEVNVLQTDLSGLIKAAECLQVKGLAVADDVPLSSPKSTSSKQDTSKTSKRVSSSSNISSSKRTRRERGRAPSSDEEDVRDAAGRSKSDSENKECNETSDLLVNSNPKCAGNSRTSKKTSQEIVLDDIKSEAFSPKVEEELDYPNESTFFDGSSDTAVLSSKKATHSNYTQKQDEDDSRPGQSCDRQDSHQEVSSDSARCGGDDDGDGGGEVPDCSPSDDDSPVCRSEGVVCTSPAVVSMSPRESSTPDEVVGAIRSSLSAPADDAPDASRAFASPDASSLLSRLRDDDPSNPALRGTVFSSEDFCMSRDIDLVVNSLRDQQQMNLSYYHLGGNGTSSSGLLPSITSPTSSNSSMSASAASSFLHNFQGSPYVPRSFVCETCGRRFNQKHHLRHHNYTHTGERPYSCPHCEQTFTQTSSRNKHIKTIHPYARSNSLNLESHFDNA
ncbi:BTB/POZ domain [Trinorchestia longiramus]|nr:BTB/POZ domain [Trinorchestia longiramus]